MSELLKKYQTIDESKITDKDKEILTKLKERSQNFMTEDAQKITICNKVLDQVIQNNPEAIIKQKKAPKAKATHKPKHIKAESEETTEGKSKNIMVLAKSIQKKDEPWKDALARAREILKKEKTQQVEKRKGELEMLHELVRTRKELKGFGKSDIIRDAHRKAKPRGVRYSTKEGFTSNQYGTFKNRPNRKYWETRDGHGDRLAPDYAKNDPYLESGGKLEDSPFNVYVYANEEDYKEAYAHKSERQIQSFETAKKYADKMIKEGNFVAEIMSESGQDWKVDKNGMTKFESGGVLINGDVLYDLAGHAGGSFTTGMPSQLDGYTGTNYTGLVGETGALSSGEMFEKGGALKDLNFTAEEQQNFTEKQTRIYDAYATHKNSIVDLKEQLRMAKARKDNDEVKSLESKIRSKKFAIKSLLDAFEGESTSDFPEYERGKNYAVKTISTSDYEKYGLEDFPNFSKTGSIAGMKKLYYGKDALLVRCGNYIYNVTSKPEIYFNNAYELGGGVKATSTKRIFNSSLIEYANFEDDSHINLIRLNRPYKSGLAYAVALVQPNKKSQGFLFTTLAKAKVKFDALVEVREKSIAKTSYGVTNNYAYGGGVEPENEKIKVVVIDECALGLIYPWSPDYVEIHSNKPQKGSYFHNNQTVLLPYGHNTRLANAADFEEYRMHPDNYKNTEEYEYDMSKNVMADGGAVELANQQVIDAATHHFENYYLGEGAAQGIYEEGGELTGFKDLSQVNVSKIETQEIDAFGSPDKLYIIENGNRIADFYYNMKGFNKNFILKNKEGVSFHFGEKSKTTQVSQFKKALKEGFVYIKGYDNQYESGGKLKMDELYVSVCETEDGYWFVTSKPCSKEDAEYINSLAIPCMNYETAKVVPLSEAIAHKKIVDRKDFEKFLKEQNIEFEDGGDLMDIYSGTGFIDNNVFEFGGTVNREFNKEVRALAISKGFTMDKLGRDEYNILITQALRESLTDGNYHEYARKVVSKAENKKWNDKMYESVYFNPPKNVKDFAREVSKRCHWEGDDILNAYYYITKMEGSKVSAIVESLFESNNSIGNKYINHDEILSVTVHVKGKSLTYKASDVLNGAHILEKGGDLTDKAFYVPKRDVISVQLKNGETVNPSNGYWIKKSAKGTKQFIPTVEFNQGDVVWDKTHKDYGVVMDNYGNAKEGDRGEIRLDSNGNQPVFTFTKDWKENGYNLVKLGSKEDMGDGDLTHVKSSANKILKMRKDDKDKEMYNYYQSVYKRLLDGEFDGKAKVKNTALKTDLKLREFDLDTLDMLEKQQYDHMVKNMPKQQVLQVLINNAEGDYSQLSEGLATIAKEQDKDENKFEEGGYFKSDEYKELESNMEKLDMAIKMKVIQAVGIDGATDFYNVRMVVNPWVLIKKAILANLITIDEINQSVVDAAMAESEEIDEQYSGSGQGIGSSDLVAFTRSFLSEAGFDVNYYHAKLTRYGDDGKPIIINNGYNFETGGYNRNADDEVYVQTIEEEIDLNDDAVLRVRPAVDFSQRKDPKEWAANANPQAYEYMTTLPKIDSSIHKKD